MPEITDDRIVSTPKNLRAMRKFTIVPHHGVGPIRLGMSRSQVHEQFGEPDFVIRDRTREVYFSAFVVDFNKEDQVEFIELAKSEEFRGLFEGKCLHELPVDEAVAFVSQFGTYDTSDHELGYSYIFLDLQLSLWRGTIADPDQPEGDPDGRYFESVGIAVDGYFPVKVAELVEIPLQVDKPTVPCPQCGFPLRSEKAKQCFQCGADWH